MKVGMNLLLWTDMPTRKHIPLIRKIKEWGFDGIELSLDDMEMQDVKEIAEELKKSDMGAAGIVALPADVADPINPEKRLRDAAVEYMKRCIDKAAVLGADVIAGPMYQGLGRFTGKGPTQQEKEWCAETFTKLAPYAKENNVVLAGEPINRFETYFVNTVDQAIEIVDMVNHENFGIHGDTHHGNIEELDIRGAWKKAGKRIKHIHISENTRGIPGTGPAVYPELFQTIREIGYDGWLNIEAFNQSVPGLIARLHLWRPFAESDDMIAIEGCKYIRKYM
ncbi:isomerase [Christensenellaceae bacterium]|nr:isomerase [Christensenellaceae bacterium]BDF62332.1 isomerase [Christensenellaceae bacterium]